MSNVFHRLYQAVFLNEKDVEAWKLGFPLQGLAAMAISPSGDKLFTSAFIDDAVAAFSIDAVDGSLALLAWIQDGTMDKVGRRVDGLHGAYGISVSQRHLSEEIYIAGWYDQAVTVLQAEADGSFVFMD